jgi:hypothetical protein
MARRIKAMFALDQYPIIGFDGGNDKTKTSVIINPRLAEPPGEESRYFRDSIQQNAVIEITEHVYQREAARYKNRRPNYGFLEYDDKFYVTGNTAIPYIRDYREMRHNKAKYTREYFGLQFVRGVLDLFGGNPPGDVHVVAGHPPMNADKRDSIIAALEGSWSFKAMHETIKFRVHTVFVDDEITCAALNERYRIDGSINSAFRQDGIALGFDLGGGTVDVMYIGTDGYPIAGTHASAAIGLSECVWNFKELFDEKHGKLFPNSPHGISMDSVYKIFMDDDHALRSGALEKGSLACGDIFERATHGELNKLFSAINNIAPDYETRVDCVKVYGGGGELLYLELADSLFEPFFKNNNLHLAAPEKGKSILNASRGMCKLGVRLRRFEAKELAKAAN